MAVPAAPRTRTASDRGGALSAGRAAFDEEPPMADDPNQPVLLTTAPSEGRAAVLVAALDAHGIEAEMVGGLTAGFKAEAPGEVRILVPHAQLEKARAALAEIEAEARRNESEPDDES